MGLLDLVALATVCDVMPLTGVNRAFVCQGLKIMARRSRPGIAALLDVTQARDKLNAATCGYALGPRINAGGRISEADLGLRLLLSRGPDRGAGTGRKAGGGEPHPPGRRGGHHGSRDVRRRDPGRRRTRGGAGDGAGVASRRGRHRRRPDQGTLQPPGLRGGLRRWGRQGVRPLGAGRRSGIGGDRRSAGRAAGHRRRPRDGGRVLGAGRTLGAISTPSWTSGWPPRLPCPAPPI